MAINAMEQIYQERGIRNIGRGEGAIMNKVSREGLTKKVAFEQRPEGSEGANQAKI